MISELEQPLRHIAQALAELASTENSAWGFVVLDARYVDAGGVQYRIRYSVPGRSLATLLSSHAIDLP